MKLHPSLYLCLVSLHFFLLKKKPSSIIHERQQKEEHDPRFIHYKQQDEN
jgi:hypothetical protein